MIEHPDDGAWQRADFDDEGALYKAEAPATGRIAVTTQRRMTTSSTRRAVARSLI